MNSEADEPVANDESAQLPPWVREVFSQFVDRNGHFHQVLRLSMLGLSFLPARPTIIELARRNRLHEDDTKRDLEQYRREAELAQREVDNDFPVLCEQGTIALWSGLEVLVRTLVAGWLENNRDVWKTEQVGRLRVRLSDYESLQPLERCLWVADLLDQEVNGPRRNGINRFEALLQPLGLDGEVDEACSRDLFELSQVRHAIVHRGAYADRKLSDACPWLGMQVGEKMKITPKMWWKYNVAARLYALELWQRVRLRFGLERSQQTDLRAAVGE